MQKIFSTIMHIFPLVYIWLLQPGSWQFVLSKWYLPMPLPSPSLDVVQCRRSQTELSLRGTREKNEKLPPDDNALTRGFTIL